MFQCLSMTQGKGILLLIIVVQVVILPENLSVSCGCILQSRLNSYNSDPLVRFVLKHLAIVSMYDVTASCSLEASSNLVMSN